MAVLKVGGFAVVGLRIRQVGGDLVRGGDVFVAVCASIMVFFGFSDVLLLLQLAHLVLCERLLGFSAGLAGELAASMVLDLLLYSAMRTMNALIAEFGLHRLFRCLVVILFSNLLVSSILIVDDSTLGIRCMYRSLA